MKKMMMLFGLILFLSVGANAQSTSKAKVETANGKVKGKPKTTPSQKVHNIIHPKRKKTSGYKVKGKKD